MRIVIATGIFPPDIGGPATYAKLLQDELPKKGIAVDIVTYGKAGISHRIPKGIKHVLFFLSCVRKAIGAEAIFAQDTTSAGVPAMLAAKIMRKKFIVRTPGDCVWEQCVQRFGVQESIDEFQKKTYGWKVELFRSLQNMVVNAADAVIAPSKYFAHLVKGWVKNPAKVTHIYNGIDINAIHDMAKDVSVKNESHVIVSAGRLVPWKGFSELVEVIERLPIHWQLHIIGEGPEQAHIETQIQEKGLSERVRLFGRCTRKELFEHVLGAKIFALNTAFESFSFQLVEVMALGTPIITTNIGNLPEIITHEKEGVLCDVNDITAFVEGILRIEEDAAFRKLITEQASKKSALFSIDQTVTSVYALLQRVCE